MQMSFINKYFIPVFMRCVSVALLVAAALFLIPDTALSCPKSPKKICKFKPKCTKCYPCRVCGGGGEPPSDGSIPPASGGGGGGDGGGDVNILPISLPWNINVGVPQLSLSPDRANTIIEDTPILYRTAIGPGFIFNMVYSSTDDRGRTNIAWDVGYKWRHNYQLHVEKTGTNYQMVVNPNDGPVFTSNGGVFIEQETYNRSRNEYKMEWAGSNIVVRQTRWENLSAENSGASGCASCGGCGGVNRPAGPDAHGLLPAYASWSARDGYEFEPDGSGTRYRLVKIIGNDEKEMTLGYSNNLLSVVTTADNKEFLFSYTANGLLTQISDPFNRSAQFTYTTNGLLETVTDMADQTFKYGYNASGYLTSLMRPATNGWDTTTIAYQGDYDGNIRVNITYPEGNVGSVNWNGDYMIMQDSQNGLGGSVIGGRKRSGIVKIRWMNRPPRD